MSIDFLAVGHITHDLAPDGFRLGGTVTYAAVTALRLGRKPAIVTCASPELLRIGPNGHAEGAPGGPLRGIPIALTPSPVSTTFKNVYHEGERTQFVTAVAGPVTPDVLPPQWSASPIVLLGPVARETPPAWLPVFPNALLGMTPQGMMRQWDAEGRVSFGGWTDAEAYLRRADVVILSREDVGGDDRFLTFLESRARLLVITDGWHGAVLYEGGTSRRVPPRPAREVDPTGAGDVFATAFLIRLSETKSPYDAVRFANIVASMSVEGTGIEAVPYRAQVDDWLAREATLS